MLATYVLCVHNSNLEMTIAGNQRSLQCNNSKSPYYSPLPPQRGLETGGGGVKIIVISREVLGWGGMDVFWNYTLQCMYFQVHYGMWLKGFS